MRSETFDARHHCLEALYPDEDSETVEDPDNIDSTIYDYIEQIKDQSLLSGREYTYEEVQNYLCGNVKVEFYSFNRYVESKAYL